MTKCQQILSEAGILCIFCSPDLNPIEELFSYIKYYHDDMLNVLIDPKPIIKAAFDSVTSEDCIGWIKDSGYAII